MSKEYIEKEAALNSVCYDCCEQAFCGSPCVDYERISGLPPADVKPVVKGEWIEAPDYLFDNVYTCSACGSEFVLEAGTPEDNEYNFCPNCGAEMRKEENDER